MQILYPTRVTKFYPLGGVEKQTQFKPNSNPMPKMVINPYVSASYTRKPPSGGHENKANSNPILKTNTSCVITSRYVKIDRWLSWKAKPNKANNQSSIIPNHAKGSPDSCTQHLQVHWTKRLRRLTTIRCVS
jgi:hypothetical protein